MVGHGRAVLRGLRSQHSGWRHCPVAGGWFTSVRMGRDDLVPAMVGATKCHSKARVCESGQRRSPRIRRRYHVLVSFRIYSPCLTTQILDFHLISIMIRWLGHERRDRFIVCRRHRTGSETLSNVLSCTLTGVDKVTTGHEYLRTQLGPLVGTDRIGNNHQLLTNNFWISSLDT